MSLRDKLYDVSEKMHQLIKLQANVMPLYTEDFGWENHRYYGPKFRLAHVERFFQEGMLVVHVTVFPAVIYSAPIFGFDIVANEKNGKIMAAFIDYSETGSQVLPWHNEEWKTDKRLPDWTHIFSDQFVAIRPEPEEYDKLLDFGLQKMIDYFTLLNNWESDYSKITDNIEAQNNYCAHQAQNKKTFAALKRIVGADRASYFMNHVLFPRV